MTKSTKKVFGFVFAFVMAALVFAGAHTAKAAQTTQATQAIKLSTSENKVTRLTERKVYSVNLNGGAQRENLSYSTSVDKTGRTSIRIFVDQKEVYKKRLTKHEPSKLASVKVADIKKNDSRREIFINAVSKKDSWVIVLRYNKANKIEEYAKASGVAAFKDAYKKTSTEGMTVDGEGRFYLQIDTPYKNKPFGSYKLLVPATLSGKKIKFKSADSYAITGLSSYVEKFFGKKTYIAGRDIPVYTEEGEDDMTLTEWSAFTPLSLFPGDSIKDKSGIKYTELFVKARFSDNGTGVMIFPANSKKKYLRKVPKW